MWIKSLWTLNQILLEGKKTERYLERCALDFRYWRQNEFVLETDYGGELSQFSFRQLVSVTTR